MYVIDKIFFLNVRRQIAIQYIRQEAKSLKCIQKCILVYHKRKFPLY